MNPKFEWTLVGIPIGAIALLIIVFIPQLNLFRSNSGTTHNGSELHRYSDPASGGLSFEKNLGQVESQFDYQSRNTSFDVFLSATRSVLTLGSTSDGSNNTSRNAHPALVETLLVGARLDSESRGLNQLPGQVNYLIGSDPDSWQTNIPLYSKVQYYDIYPGIDIVYYGSQDRLAYDFIISPWSDPSAITFRFRGVDGIRLDDQGSLVLDVAGNELHHSKPMLYQVIQGIQQPIDGGFEMRGSSEVGFKVLTYDPSLPLVIDPIVEFSTFLGGGSQDSGVSIEVDSLGNIYVAGTTGSSNFPTTPGAFDESNTGGNAFVSKFTADGGALIYSTYIGGSGGDWIKSNGLAVDSSGAAYIAGFTTSQNFPTTAGALDETWNGGGDVQYDAFVSKLTLDGSDLEYSTYLGGSAHAEWAYAIDVDLTGSAYVTGFTRSSDFPTTPGSFDITLNGQTDVFVSKLNPSGSALAYSTYVGGGRRDSGSDIEVDGSGAAYVAGGAEGGFPTTSGAFDETYNSGLGASVAFDGFLFKLNPAGSALVYSTYLGGEITDSANGVGIDDELNAYVTGYSASSSFPTTVDAFDESYNGNTDAFVAKLNATGSTLQYSTYLGGSGGEIAYAIDVNPNGSAYITGPTSSTNFPAADPIQTSNAGGNDAFIIQLSASGANLEFSTYLGGSDNDGGSAIVVDGSGSIYVTGGTSSNNFPTTPGAFDEVFNGSDGFLAEISPGVGPPPPSVEFLDDFDDTSFDSNLWNTSIATSGVRWCTPELVPSLQFTSPGEWIDPSLQTCLGMTVLPPFGSINVAGGQASFSAGAIGAFPYIWAGPPSRPSPFPNSGDFILTVRMTYDDITVHGDGFRAVYWEDTTPIGNNPPWPSGQGVFAIWSHGVGLLGETTSIPDPLASHEYSLQYVTGAYWLFVDGELILGPIESDVRPNTIWIGNPIVTHWGLFDWTDFTLDLVSVSSLASGAIDLAVANLNAIQVVDTADINDDGRADLVQDKPAVVRVQLSLAPLEALELTDLSIDTQVSIGNLTMTASRTIAELIESDFIVDFFMPCVGSEPCFRNNGEFDITAIVDPFNAIFETVETNNQRNAGVSVKDAKGLYVAYFPVNCFGQLTEYSSTVAQGGEFLQALFPFSPAEFRNEIFDSSIRCLFDAELQEDESPDLALNTDAYSLWLTAKDLSDGQVERVVGVVDENYRNSRMGGSLGKSFCAEVPAVFVLDGHWEGVPHELAHTYRIGHPPGDDQCDFNYVLSLGPTGGYWVERSTEVGEVVGLQSLMAGGPPANNPPLFPYPDRWITKGDYEYLFREHFRHDPGDPSILLVGGILKSDGGIEWLPFYRLPNGIVDVATPGEYKLRVLDPSGNLLYELSFGASFFILGDTAEESDVIPFMFAVPFNEQADRIQVIRNSQLLTQANIATKLLHDAVDAIPDAGFRINPDNRRNALHNKINALERMIDAGENLDAVDKLKNDIRDRLSKWLFDDYQLDNILQYSKEEILALVDETIAGLEGR